MGAFVRWRRCWALGPPDSASSRVPCCKMAALSTATEFDGLRVVLVSTRNPLNIGAAARAMSNFGFLHLRVVNPYAIAFREAQSAVGASALLAEAKEFKTVAEAVADCTLVVGTTAAGRRHLRHPLRRLEDGARLIRKRLTTGNVAMLFGSEKRGLSNQDLSHCDWLIRIPTREEHRSMNLGQAVAVCLYELARSAKPGRAPLEGRAATASDVERIVGKILAALGASGSLEMRSESGTRENVRRLIHRHKLSADDAEFWLGMLHPIVKKLTRESGSKG
jgi:TrmH family RNA methyltransferase